MVVDLFRFVFGLREDLLYMICRTIIVHLYAEAKGYQRKRNK
jgi:hypothetical protein